VFNARITDSNEFASSAVRLAVISASFLLLAAQPDLTIRRVRWQFQFIEGQHSQVQRVPQLATTGLAAVNRRKTMWVHST
jgi:hypothetical protein